MTTKKIWHQTKFVTHYRVLKEHTPTNTTPQRGNHQQALLTNTWKPPPTPGQLLQCAISVRRRQTRGLSTSRTVSSRSRKYSPHQSVVNKTQGVASRYSVSLPRSPFRVCSPCRACPGRRRGALTWNKLRTDCRKSKLPGQRRVHGPSPT